MSPALSDPLATSSDTWRDHAVAEPAVPPELVPPRDAPWRERLSALHRRHLLRERRALDTYAASRNPVRGWPVADNHVVLAFFRGLLRERKGIFFWLIVLNAAAAATALVVPRLLGNLVDTVSATINGDETHAAARSSLDHLALVIIAVVITQAVLTFLAQMTSTIFGQDLLSSAREFIVGTVLRLPLGRVEGASTGDLVTRVTRDVGTMSRSVQFGVPQAIISGLTVALSVVAMLLNSVLLAVPSLLVIGSSWFQVRRYLQRAPKGYITEGATYSRINTTLTETTEGARTVEALGLSDLRVRAGDDDMAVSGQAERYTMTLRNLLFTVIDVAFNSPRVITLLVGGYGHSQGWVSLGQITAALLYVESLSGPLDRLVGEMDRLQVGVASTSRLLGIAEVPEDRTPGNDRPGGTPSGRGGPPLRLPRGARRTPRGVARPPRRGAPGDRRAVGVGQVDARPAAVGHQRAAHGFGDRGWGRPGGRCRWSCSGPRSRWSRRSTTSSSARCATTSSWRGRTPPTRRSTTPCRRWARATGWSGCRRASTR